MNKYKKMYNKIMKNKTILELIKKHVDNLFVVKEYITPELIFEIKKLELSIPWQEGHVLSSDDIDLLVKCNIRTNIIIFDNLYFEKSNVFHCTLDDIHAAVILMDTLSKNHDLHQLRNCILKKIGYTYQYRYSNIDMYIKYGIPYIYSISNNILNSNQKIVEHAYLFKRSLKNCSDTFETKQRVIDAFKEKLKIIKNIGISSVIAIIDIFKSEQINCSFDQFKKIFKHVNIHHDYYLKNYLIFNFKDIYAFYNEPNNIISYYLKTISPEIDSFLSSLILLETNINTAEMMLINYLNPNHLEESEFLEFCKNDHPNQLNIQDVNLI